MLSTTARRVTASSLASRYSSLLMAASKRTCTTTTQWRPGVIVNHFATVLPQSVRFYSPSTPLYKKKKKPDFILDPENVPDELRADYQVLNNHNLSDEEIRAIMAEQEAELEQEEQAKFVPNWKPGMRRRPLKWSISLEEFAYELEPEKYAPRWTLRDKRTGALAIKVGMMPVYDEWGVRHPCTVLFLDQNVVLGHKTMEQHGYSAVQIAAGQRKRKNVGKSVLGQYKAIMPDVEKDDAEEEKDHFASKENPPYLVREFRITDEANLPPVGSRIHARHFVPGQNIDVSGISKGKGFQGGMKRHNFAGMPASHGVSRSHRAIGSTGQCQDPGRVFKGKKMPGHMGSERITVQNLRIVKIDRGRNLLFVVGAVPGSKGQFVELRDAVKRPLWKTNMVLDSVDRPPLPTFACDESIDGCGQAGHDVFMPMPDTDPLDPDYNDTALSIKV